MTTHLRRRAAALLASAAAIAALAASAPLSAQAALPAPPSGWSQVWVDDFARPAGTGVNTTDWLYSTGTGYPGGPYQWGTGEIETMTASTANVSHDGRGNLRITPLRDRKGNWTSGRIETRRTDFQPAEGTIMRIEARIQMPNVTGAKAQGYWPAFWALGAPYRGVYTNWPAVGEIDVMENVNGVNRVWGTLHCGIYAGGPCNETTGLGGSIACPGSTCQSAFHVYRVEWDRSRAVEQLRWYVDGVLYDVVNETDVDATTWANATDHGFFLILNVAIGGGWPGQPTPQTKPGVPMIVDYVAVLQTR